MKPNTKTWKFTITKKILKHAKEKPVKNEIKKNIIRLLGGKVPGLRTIRGLIDCSDQ